MTLPRSRNAPSSISQWPKGLQTRPICHGSPASYHTSSRPVKPHPHSAKTPSATPAVNPPTHHVGSGKVTGARSRSVHLWITPFGRSSSLFPELLVRIGRNENSRTTRGSIASPSGRVETAVRDLSHSPSIAIASPLGTRTLSRTGCRDKPETLDRSRSESLWFRRACFVTLEVR